LEVSIGVVIGTIWYMISRIKKKRDKNREHLPYPYIQ